jgi:hypothetical protein
VTPDDEKRHRSPSDQNPRSKLVLRQNQSCQRRKPWYCVRRIMTAIRDTPSESVSSEFGQTKRQRLHHEIMHFRRDEVAVVFLRERPCRASTQ